MMDCALNVFVLSMLVFTAAASFIFIFYELLFAAWNRDLQILQRRRLVNC